eukprot:GHVU01008023.1.p1 GENE.GHVU01008023.1~~GHVU01008023.1.p1  ORF type:complete len:131 (-),score=1.17 GHVU01008023.1:370-762(-)
MNSDKIFLFIYVRICMSSSFPLPHSQSCRCHHCSALPPTHSHSIGHYRRATSPYPASPAPGLSAESIPAESWVVRIARNRGVHTLLYVPAACLPAAYLSAACLSAACLSAACLTACCVSDRLLPDRCLPA